jgi:hypothetical protein
VEETASAAVLIEVLPLRGLVACAPSGGPPHEAESPGHVMSQGAGYGCTFFGVAFLASQATDAVVRPSFLAPR